VASAKPGSADADADLSAVQENLSAAGANAELQARRGAGSPGQDYEKLAQLKSDTLSEAQQAAGEPGAAKEAPPAQGAQQPTAPEPGLVEQLLGNTVALVAALGALLLAMLFFLFKRRRTVEEFVPA
jgi:hypothetical protein